MIPRRSISRLRRLAPASTLVVALCGAAWPALASAPLRPLAFQPTGVSADELVGVFALGQNDLPTAADRLLLALALDPGNADLRSQAFLAAVLAGRPEALALARQLPANGMAALLLADADVKAGEWQRAQEHFARLGGTGLTQVLQPLLLAWTLQGAGNSQAALALLEPLIGQSAARGLYALHAAMIADLAGQDNEAERLYLFAAANEPAGNLRVAEIIASWEARHGHRHQADRILSDMAEQGDALGVAVPGLQAAIGARVVPSANDGIAEAYLALAGSLHQQSADDYAQILLQLALDLRPDFTTARLLLSEVQQDRGRPALAQAALAPVAANDRMAMVVRLRRAVLTDQLGNTDQALHDLRGLAAELPDHVEPLAQIGQILLQKNRFADAVIAYTQAIDRIHPPRQPDWRLFYSRGIANERSHHWPQAQADLEHALLLSPDQPAVLNYLGYSWADQNRNLSVARQLIDRAVHQRPNDGMLVDSLGWVKLRQGDIAGAVHDLEHAAELAPEDATVNGHLGDAYLAAGRTLEATYQWRRALTLNPEPDDAAHFQAELHKAAPGGLVQAKDMTQAGPANAAR